MGKLKDGDKTRIEERNGEKHLIRESEGGHKEDLGKLYQKSSGKWETRHSFQENFEVEKPRPTLFSDPHKEYSVKSSEGYEGSVQRETSNFPLIGEQRRFRENEVASPPSAGEEISNADDNSFSDYQAESSPASHNRSASRSHKSPLLITAWALYCISVIVWWLLYLARVSHSPGSTDMPKLMGWNPTSVPALNIVIDAIIIVLIPGIVASGLAFAVVGLVITIVILILEAFGLAK